MLSIFQYTISNVFRFLPFFIIVLAVGIVSLVEDTSVRVGTFTITAILTVYLGYLDYTWRLKKDIRLKYLTDAFMQLCSFANRCPAHLEEKRIRENKEKLEQSFVKTLLDETDNFNAQAYNFIAREYNKYLEEAEKAITIINLYGTSKEINLAQEIVNSFKQKKVEVGLDDLLDKLRLELREELNFEPAQEKVENLRLFRSFPKEENSS